MKLTNIIIISTLVAAVFVGIIIYMLLGIGHVPVIKVQAVVTVTDNKPTIRIVEMKQDFMNVLECPRGDSKAVFPEVDAKAIVNRATMSYWAARHYHGNGTYNFTIGFPEGAEPKPGDRVMVIVQVVDRSGQPIARDVKEQEV